MKEEKKRWVMPKFLPLKYDVKLITEDKVCFLCFALIFGVICQAGFRDIMCPKTLTAQLCPFCSFVTDYVPAWSLYDQAVYCQIVGQIFMSH